VQIDVQGGPRRSRGVPGGGFGRKSKENRAENFLPDCLQIPSLLTSGVIEGPRTANGGPGALTRGPGFPDRFSARFLAGKGENRTSGGPAAVRKCDFRPSLKGIWPKTGPEAQKPAPDLENKIRRTSGCLGPRRLSGQSFCRLVVGRFWARPSPKDPLRLSKVGGRIFLRYRLFKFSPRGTKKSAPLGAGNIYTMPSPAGVRPGPGRGPGVDFYVFIR